MLEEQFSDVLQTYQQHDYGRAAGMAWAFLSETKRIFHSIVQVLVISLDRNSQDDVLEQIRPVALGSFDNSPWAVALVKLSLGEMNVEEIRGIANDTTKQAQLLYYEGARLLTQGDRSGAADRFEQCSATRAECPEVALALSAMTNPEPALTTLTRTVVRAARFGVRQEAASCLHAVTLALEILRTVPATHGTAVSHLNALTAILEGLANTAQTRALSDQLNRLMQEAGPAPVVHLASVREMGASISTALSLPLKRFVGIGKQLDITALSPMQRTALLFGFPLFLGRNPAFAHRENPIWELLRESGIDGDSEGSPYCRRRFSGDASADFPRTRYYAVCSDDDGSDERTLVSELNAYTVPHVTGYCVARSTPHPATIELVFRGLPDDPNPLAEALSDPNRPHNYFDSVPGGEVLREAFRSASRDQVVSQETELVIPVTCRLTRLDIAHALDLRQPDARDWLIGLFNHPPKGLIGESLACLCDAHGVDTRAISTWQDLLPIVGTRNFGGNPLTDMVGTLLRHLGCEALVYPSARNDYAAIFENGALLYSRGWNLVDYRDAPQLGKVGLDFGDAIEPLSGENILEEHREGPRAGSLVLKGNGLYTRIASEMAWHERTVLAGSEWRLKHRQGELLVRGYMWYRRRYSLTDRSVVLTCDSCHVPATQSRSELMWACPNCQYGGDL